MASQSRWLLQAGVVVGKLREAMLTTISIGAARTAQAGFSPAPVHTSNPRVLPQPEYLARLQWE
jgi:hypothetical protein